MIRKCLYVLLIAGVSLSAQTPDEKPGVRKIHLIQDDAQDYMVSKIYKLKYVQSNDIAPFVTGMVMRYNINSSVGSIEYGSNNSQLLCVTCPVKMMPSVDDFILKADRNVPLSGKEPGEIVKGTGITRAVYRPKYRSGQNLLNVLVNSVIGEGPYSSVYAWDSNSNQIYWKDNKANTEYVYQFLGYLDRPAPQIRFELTLFEVRESTLRDIGIEYLAWKNGPGLNLFQTAFKSFSITSGGSSALQAMSGPLGGFFVAPQFDASFIRVLEQNGTARIKDTAMLTVSNSDSSVSSIYFSPEFQNIVKSNNDQTSVQKESLGLEEGMYQAMLRITAPIVNIHYGQPQEGYPATEAFSVADYTPGEYVKYKGTVKSNEEIADVIREANYTKECAGIVTWCHTFSPSKMWINGLAALSKPYCHLATQYNKEIPNEEIDMDFMNLNQAAHGDREHGFIAARLRIPRKVIAGYWKNASVTEKLGDWMRSAVGVAVSKEMKVMRFGDNMRGVAVTEGTEPC